MQLVWDLVMVFFLCTFTDWQSVTKKAQKPLAWILLFAVRIVCTRMDEVQSVRSVCFMEIVCCSSSGKLGNASEKQMHVNMLVVYTT